MIAVGEDKVLALLLARRQHDGHLLGGHRQHGQLDAIELVEAAPGARLGEALVDATETSANIISLCYKIVG